MRQTSHKSISCRVQIAASDHLKKGDGCCGDKLDRMLVNWQIQAKCLSSRFREYIQLNVSNRDDSS